MTMEQRSERFKARLQLTGLLALLAPWTIGVAGADDFYSGKRITIVVSTDAGGSYDMYARLMADVMPRHIPGQPTIVVQNMPGAGGLRAVNYIFNTAPTDGTVIAATYGSIPTSSLLAQEGARYDATKLNWLGSITKDPFVGYLWHEAPVKTWREFYTKEVTVSTQAVGSASADFAIMSNAILGTKIKLILGYKGSPESQLAIQRGEVMGNFATAYNTLQAQTGNLLREGKFKIVVQHGLSRIPELPNVPLLIDEARTEDDRRLLEVFLARQETGKPYFLPPGVPADRIAILRHAFLATLKDDEFMRRVKQANLEMTGPMNGEEVAALVSRVNAAPPSIISRIKKVFEDFTKTPQ